MSAYYSLGIWRLDSSGCLLAEHIVASYTAFHNHTRVDTHNSLDTYLSSFCFTEDLKDCFVN